MRLVFRVDASYNIGTGHVMRCLAIIEEAVLRNISCVVVGSLGGIDWIKQRLMQLGITHVAYLDFSQISKDNDVLVIDSYELLVTDSFIQPVYWKSVVSIADEGTPNYSSNLIIHPGIDPFIKYHTETKLLTGVEYIPLRKSIKKTRKIDSGKVGKVVIFGGGSDKFQLAKAVAHKLIEIKEFDCAIFFTDLKQEISSLDKRFQVVEFGPALDSQLEDTDLVITTASTSSLEIIAREIPLGVCNSANNQATYLKAITEKGLAIGIGSLNNSGIWDLDSNVIKALFQDPHLRVQLRKNSHGFLDLLGSQRIVDELQKL